MYLQCIYGLKWHFCNYVVSIKARHAQNSIPNKPNGDPFTAYHMEFLVWHNLMKPHFTWYSTSQHHSGHIQTKQMCQMFKPCCKQSTKADWVKFKQSDVAKACWVYSIITAFSAILSPPQSQRLKADMVATCCIAPNLKHCHVLGVYEQCCIRPLKVLHKCCNMDVLRIPPTYP